MRFVTFLHSRGRFTLRQLLFLVVPVALLALGVYSWLFGGRYVSTDNAYVKADVVNVSAEVSGRITAVAVIENQPVRAGALLLEIDTQPYEVALRDAEARLQQSRLDIASLKATYVEKQSELAAARDDLVFAEKELRRIKDLHGRGAISQAALDKAQHDLDVAGNTVRQLQGESDKALAEMGGAVDLPVDQHPVVLVASTALEKARLDLRRCRVVAPINGITANVPNAGQYVMPGLPAISVVSNENVWVEANFKEDQLAGIQAGAPVEVHIDAYPDQQWHAIVQSLGQATGAEFSLLPPQNATGNWVKVVQRVPVRLAIQRRQGEPELRAGLSAKVIVDTQAPLQSAAVSVREP